MIKPKYEMLMHKLYTLLASPEQLDTIVRYCQSSCKLMVNERICMNTPGAAQLGIVKAK